jgi:VWFA-related protein
VRIAITLALLLAGARLEGDQAEAEPRLIDLNVVALDSHGRPVNDLTVDDFQVSDNGKLQKVAFFRHYDSNLLVAPPRGPDEYSNRAGAPISRATVILLDLLNEGFGTRGNAENELVRYLGSVEDPSDLYLYFLTLDGKLYPVRGIPILKPQSPAAEPWTRGIKQLMDNALHTVMRVRPAEIDVAVREQLTYAALDNLAVQLSRVPGHKNIVWITDGIPVTLGPYRSDTGDYVDFTPQIRQMSEALDRSGIAIYPVRQVMLGSPTAIGDASGGGNGGGFTGGSGLGSLDTLDQFAGMTGGRPDVGKDIGAAIKQAMSDARTSYQVAYYPPERNWDGKFHKIRIVTKRKGVRLQSKTGYYAWPEPPDTRAREAIDQTAAAPFDATEIGLRVKVSLDTQDRSAVSLDAHIDANDIVLLPDGGTYRGQLRVALATYSADEPPQISSIMHLDLHYSSAEIARVLKEGIPFTGKLQIAENTKTLRLIVFDRGSSTVGSISVPPKSAAHGQP